MGRPTAAERARREQMRLAAAELIEAGVSDRPCVETGTHTSLISDNGRYAALAA
jgi:hypothetical protein